MEKRRRRANTENEYKKNKRSKKGKLTCFIMFALMIFVYYQVIVLIKYTSGKPIEENKLKIYSWVNDMVSSRSDKDEKDTNTNIINK